MSVATKVMPIQALVRTVFGKSVVLKGVSRSKICSVTGHEYAEHTTYNAAGPETGDWLTEAMEKDVLEWANKTSDKPEWVLGW